MRLTILGVSGSIGKQTIDIIETNWGNRYISLKDVYKLLDDRFDEHHEIK